MVKAEPGLMVTPNVRLKSPLGAGGMGSVWLADHLALHTEVVVKFMSAELAESPEAVARFAREAAAAAQVKSPQVVQMLDHGVMEGGVPYIVMEHLDGRDLAAHLEMHGRLSPREAASVLSQLARALDKAHERGIVHRDIKPPNVFLLDGGGGDPFVKLLDFGIAKSADLTLVGSTTRTGSVVGSPYYMSPEQVVGAKDIDYRTDLWSLGVVVYEAITGEKPFYADTIGALALKIHHDPLPRPTEKNPSLPRAIDAWFEHACARDPAQRFPSARAMAEAFTQAANGEPSGPMISVVPSGRIAAPALAHTAMATASDLDAPSVALPAKRRALPAIGLVFAVALGAAGAVMFFSHRESSGVSPGPQIVATPTPTVSTPTPPSIAESVVAAPTVAPKSEPSAVPVVAASATLPTTTRTTRHVTKAPPPPASATAAPLPSAHATRPAGSEDDIR